MNWKFCLLWEYGMGDYINEVKTENHSNLPFSFFFFFFLNKKNMKYVSVVGFFFFSSCVLFFLVFQKLPDFIFLRICDTCLFQIMKL